MPELTSEQTDALTELINIGVGRAANVLNELTESHIVLKVPSIKLYSFDELDILSERFGDLPLAAVTQNFNGDYDGRAALLFPTESALNLVEGITGEEPEADDIDAIQSATLRELGNIVINALLGTISNMLEGNLQFDLSEYRQDHIKGLIPTQEYNDPDGFILLSEVHFQIEKLNINGHIILTFDVENLNTLFKMIKQVFEEG